MKKIQFDVKAVPYIIGLLVIIGFIFYWRVGVEKNPGDYNVRTGNYRLEDGQYEEAVKEFSEALGKNPGHAMARLGLALTYMQMGRDEEAMQEFDLVIENNPGLAQLTPTGGYFMTGWGSIDKRLPITGKRWSLTRKSLRGRAGCGALCTT